MKAPHGKSPPHERSGGDRGDSEPPRGCPICGKPTHPAHQPFCSKRCRQVDLHRWLSGAYVIAGRPEDDPAGEADKPKSE